MATAVKHRDKANAATLRLLAERGGPKPHAPSCTAGYFYVCGLLLRCQVDLRAAERKYEALCQWSEREAEARADLEAANAELHRTVARLRGSVKRLSGELRAARVAAGPHGPAATVAGLPSLAVAVPWCLLGMAACVALAWAGVR